ncbi:MAG: MBL fold metallo-hydrolase [Kiritimatiellae bacterium]|nr:MBL fold metallo-hydrolase [Kiritimatiellia bacterium]
MTFKFLGTGTSVGVPQIGCDCPVCTSTDPRDKRRRCGAYVRSDAAAFLLDTPPEMRVAALEYGIDKVDAVVLTHAHMDHVAGFDDVRRFNTLNGGAAMRCFAAEETVEQMHRIFPYISDKQNTMGLFRPMINFVADDEFKIGDMTLKRVKVEHNFPCSGYVIDEKLGYVSDCHELSDEAIEAFKGVEVMILNCLRFRPHPTHLNKDAALEYLEKIAPKKAYLIHMCHDVSHAEWLKVLPEGVEPAYDGLEIEL